MFPRELGGPAPEVLQRRTLSTHSSNSEQQKQWASHRPAHTSLPASSYIAPLQEVIDQLARRIVHFHVERLYTAGQIIEHHHGRDSDQQTECGGHQRFRNTASNCAETGSLLF